MRNYALENLSYLITEVTQIIYKGQEVILISLEFFYDLKMLLP